MFLNEFRLVGDVLHVSAILLLIFYIIKTRSCHSVSGITIILYTITFSCRYLDLFSLDIYSYDALFMYNTIFKIYYLISNYLILILIYGVFRNTRDKSSNTFPIFGYLIFAHLLTCVVCAWTNYKAFDKEYLRRFSIFLEIFAIIPQLSLIYKQGTISTMMTYYLKMLGSYRALYIANWIYRYNTENYWEPIGFFCGCVQTIVYIIFFIYIYPRLNNKNTYQSIEVTKDLISLGDTKECINQKTKDDVPLIHNIV